MAWIDSKNAYDMVPQSWILHSHEMYKIPDQIVQFIEKTMQTWRVEMTGEVKIQKRHIPRRCTVTITIRDIHDSTQPRP